MNIAPAGVTNAAYVSLCVGKVAYRLWTDIQLRVPGSSVLNWKVDYPGHKHVEETINMFPEKLGSVL
jgi:hypothetical protein